MNRTIFRKIGKILLWVAGIWASLLLILQIALSPAVLVRLADRIAPEYIDGELKFEKISVNMFRHFPYVGIVMENGSLTYPADRYDELEGQSVQGLLLYHGCGEKSDTLASFRHFSAGVDALALLSGKINISHVVMVRPRIFAHVYDDDNANWNIFKTAAAEVSPEGGAIPENLTEDGTPPESATFPPLSLGKIRLTDHPHIVYTDSRDTLFAMIDVKRIVFDGRLNNKNSSRNRIGLSLDSMMVAGRLAADTIGLRMDMLHIHEHAEYMDMEIGARTLLATKSFGRMYIPVSIEGTASFPEDTVPAIDMQNFKAEIAAIPVGLDMKLRKEENGIGIDGRFNIENCQVKDIIDDFIKNIIPEAKKISTDASFSLSGRCKGTLGGGSLPAVDASLKIPESSIAHQDIKHGLKLAINAGMQMDRKQKIDVKLDKAEIRTYGLQLSAKGSAADLLGGDPLMKIEGSFRAAVDSLLTFLPEDSGITAEGDLAAELKGSIRLSQMNIYNFGQAELSGKIDSDSLEIKSPKDTINIAIKGLRLDIAPETRTSKRDSTVHRLLGIGGSISKTELSLKEAFSLKAEDLDFAAKNSVEAISSGMDSKKIHPLGGHIKAKTLRLKDAAGMSVRLGNTFNSFQMVPKADNPEIPVLSLTSSNKKIFLRNISNRVILNNAKIRLGAAMNSIERRQKRKAFMDSLALAHPEIPRDSLRNFLMSQRKTADVPEWMKEEDFKSKDLNFSLNGVVADYFRQWDMNGNISVGSGYLMTPRLPLKNALNGMSLSFNNNEIRIDSLKLMSGKSDIGAKGSLYGLRRALLGRGVFNLNLDISSDRMEADVLLAALNAGAAVNLEEHAENTEEISDSEYMEMVVADSLDTTNLKGMIIVPSDLNANISLDARNISFSGLLMDELKSDITMRERCMQISKASASTNMGKVDFEAFYATRSKKDIKTGFNLQLTDISSEKVIAMVPELEEKIPLLKSFKGKLDCIMAATADLDTCMNIQLPSLNGVVRIKGQDLFIGNNQIFNEIAEALKFKNSNTANIGKMKVEGIIKNSIIEVFPFVLDLDRYTLALSGLQKFDMSYKYHASIIESPLVFKVGVDVFGQDFNKMKFNIGKPKYKTAEVPVFSSFIDKTRINLAESIRNIFEKGVENAVRENEMQKVINDHKADIGYVNAAEQNMTELSEEEKQELENGSGVSQMAVQPESETGKKTVNKLIMKE